MWEVAIATASAYHYQHWGSEKKNNKSWTNAFKNFFWQMIFHLTVSEVQIACWKPTQNEWKTKQVCATLANVPNCTSVILFSSPVFLWFSLKLLLSIKINIFITYNAQMFTFVWTRAKWWKVYRYFVKSTIFLEQEWQRQWWLVAIAKINELTLL